MFDMMVYIELLLMFLFPKDFKVKLSKPVLPLRRQKLQSLL